MVARCGFAALALLGIYGAAEAFKGRGMPTELDRPQLRLDEMPKKFGTWLGEDAPLDSRVFRAIGAEMAINRVYRSDQAQISLHSAVFTDLFMQYKGRTLHPPELCYPSSGFIVENGETIQIESAGKRVFQARLLTIGRDGAQHYCLYWYQIGDATFWNGDEQRRVVQLFRGRATWPPMIKVMLQTDANSLEEAQVKLRDFAALVYPWMRDYH